MTTPRGRPERTGSTFPPEKRGRVLLRKVTDRPADVESAAEGDDTLTNEIKSIVTRQRSVYTWWSDVQETVTFTTSAAVKSLPDVVVVGLPADVIIQRSIALFKYREISDSSAALNDMNGAFAIQVRKLSESFVTAINGVDQQFQVPASERGPGDVLIGDNDMIAFAFLDATFNFQFASIASTGSSLILRDVQCGIQIVWG